MKLSLVYHYCEHYDTGIQGYSRVNPRLDDDYGHGVVPLMDGQGAAHDFIEHPSGHPTGALEDEIAALGAMCVGRLDGGYIEPNAFWGSPDNQIAEELKGLLESYAHRTDDQHYDHGRTVITPRRRTFPERDSHIAWVAEQAADGDRRLQRHLEGWMHWGSRRLCQRFGEPFRANLLFDNLKHTFDALVKSEAQVFRIQVDDIHCFGQILPDHQWRQPL